MGVTVEYINGQWLGYWRKAACSSTHQRVACHFPGRVHDLFTSTTRFSRSFVAMTVMGRAAEGSDSTNTASLEVQYDGTIYPAEEVGHGAAFELYADRRGTGWLPNPRPGARMPFRRFVHASEISAVLGPADTPDDSPMVMPVSRVLDWPTVHRMSQSPHQTAMIAAIRQTAVIRRGTRMIKFLTARQLGGHLRGWPISGFCYRAYDVAHLRTPAELAILSGQSDDPGEVVFAIRWRAVDPVDYAIPFNRHDAYAGLVSMPPHDRLGPPVIGTGFTPTAKHLIPEFVTVDLAELPLTASASLVAYTPDGSEVTLYQYLPEQRAWTRMHGPQWRHLLNEVPRSKDGPFPVDQEYFPVPTALSRFVGIYRGELYEAIADPPGEFRVAAKTRAARYAVEALARRTPYAVWRRTQCTVIKAEGDWLRLRICRPDGDVVQALGAQCVERGVYEAWAPAAEVTDGREADTWYQLPPEAGANPAG
jgi:hypothetical protein